MPVRAYLQATCPQVLTVGELEPSSESRRLAVFDRDGTLNLDSGYTHRVEDLRLTPWIVAAALDLQSRGFTLAVASNQSGVARGLFDNSAVRSFNSALARTLAEHGVRVAQFLWCPHAPDAGCPNRKPEPGMIEWLKLVWDPTELIYIGDSGIDEEAAARAGVRFLQANCSLPSTLIGLDRP